MVEHRDVAAAGKGKYLAYTPASRWRPAIQESAMQRDVQFRVEGQWALASDGIQWVLQYYKGHQWKSVSFVHSTKDILARCMREGGCEGVIAEKLLAGLPETFDEWKSS